MFAGREHELDKLTELYDSGGFEAVVIYGRRRVGKTSLAAEFVRGREVIYFSSMESSVMDNVNLLGKLTDEHISGQGLKTYEDISEVLYKIYDIAQQKRLVLVIDNYETFVKTSNGIPRILSYCINELFPKTRLMLLLCLSSASLPKAGLPEAGPVQKMSYIQVEPFDYLQTASYLRAYAPKDAALAYAVTGGVPGYLRHFLTGKRVEACIKDSFFGLSAPLAEEPEHLLSREVREPALYNAVLKAIADGFVKNSQIAKRIDLKTSACTAYLNNLISMGFVRKRTPAGELSSKRTAYEISDGLMRFWYSFVFDSAPRIATGGADEAWKAVKDKLPEFMEKAFVEICMQWLAREFSTGESTGGAGRRSAASRGAQGRGNELDALKQWLVRESLPEAEEAAGPITPAGLQYIDSWWGGGKNSGIDIEARSEDGTNIYAACRWGGGAVGPDTLEILEAKSASRGDDKRRLFLFARDGFGKDCRERAAKSGNVSLIEFDQLYLSKQLLTEEKRRVN